MKAISKPIGIIVRELGKANVYLDFISDVI